jgi:outer membrane immunogenic protein
MRKLVLAAIAALIAGPGVAADLPVRAPAYKAAPLAAVWSWSGLYIGIDGGYGFGNDPFSQTVVRPGGNAASFEKSVVAPKGGFFGGQMGYNWQVGNIVFGVEGDAQWSGQHDKVCGFLCEAAVGFVEATTVEQKLKWFATARGRLGWANESYLLYVTGGGAWAGIDETDAFIDAGLTFVAGSSRTKSGWAVGGIETRLWGDWTAKLEYLHIDLGSATSVLPVSGASIITDSRIRDDIVRAGINYKFGYGPVVASY